MTSIVRNAQRSVIKQLCDDLMVFPLSAPQYRRLLANDADDMPFIRDIQQSGVPVFTARAYGCRGRTARMMPVGGATNRSARG